MMARIVLLLAIIALGHCQSSESPVDSSELPVSSSEPTTGTTSTTESTSTTPSNNKSAAANNGKWSRFFRKILDRPTSVQKHADKNRIILENLSLDRANPEIANITSVVAFHDEETVAVITYVKETVDNCKLMEVNYQYQAVEVLKNLSLYMPIYPVDTRTMVNLIKQCQGVRNTRPLGEKRAFSSKSIRSENATTATPTSSSNNWLAFAQTIVPGTKWCGPGDVATSYDDLGPIMDVDKCCRAHDHCPIKVKGFATAHGLVNLSLYTKSHCACDDEFFSCLKNISSPVARMIGNLYFNVIQMPCVDELQSSLADKPKQKLELLTPELCTARNGDCDGQPSVKRPFQPRPYKFVNVNRVF